MPRRSSTSTRGFGAGGRSGHDASAFYDRFGPVQVSGDETISAPAPADGVWAGDARDMISSGRVNPQSAALVVTSPPYYAGKEYEQHGQDGVPSTYGDYLEMLHEVFAVCAEALEPGGRIAVNVANIGRRPYRSLSAAVYSILADRLGLLPRGEIIWVKSRGSAGNCAWGSWCSPSNPVLRDLTERIVVASKGRFDRALPSKRRQAANLPHKPTISPEQFMESTLDLWDIRPESATRVGHPAPFPVELPLRLINLYTYEGDLVLDPFLGSGTTAVAAVRAGRRYAGCDLDDGYVGLAERRVADERQQAEKRRTAGPPDSAD